MKIAVLAWGSLIWDRRDLALADTFNPAGPRLPIEFCRVSGDGRLTLVIDEEVGITCPTYLATSEHCELDAALTNLWSREGSGKEAPPKKIRASGRVSFVLAASDECGAKAMEWHPNAVATIRAWTQTSGFDAAIWTALDSNFRQPEKGGESFSVDAATRYLDRLSKFSFARALHYIWNAPQEVQTPVRDAVNARWPAAD